MTEAIMLGVMWVASAYIVTQWDPDPRQFHGLVLWLFFWGGLLWIIAIVPAWLYFHTHQ